MKIEKNFYSTTPTQTANNSKTIKINNNYFGCNSYSGADMVAMMTISNGSSKGSYTLGSLQTLSVSTNMQRSPIRSIGNINAKDYVMGPRTIAGSLVFAVFDKHFAYEAMEAIQGEIGTYTFLADELPPFDITVTMANEYGKTSKLVIYGVRLINEGQVMSINDIYIENTYQFVAKDYDYLNDKTGASSEFFYEPLTAKVELNKNPLDILEVEEIKEDLTDEEDIVPIDNIKVIAKTSPAFNDGINVYKGSVSLNLNIIQHTGYISIFNSSDIEIYQFNLATNTLPIIQNLDAGQYTARYINLNNEESEPTNFSINFNTIDVDTPLKPIVLYQEANLNYFIIGLKSSDDISKGIVYYLKEDKDNINAYNYVVFTDEICQLELELNKQYILKAYNGNKHSLAINLNTDQSIENIFSDFKTYIQNNKNNIPKDYFSSFNTIWSKATETIVLDNKSYIISEALYNSKQNITDYYLRKTYDYFIDEAIKYEDNLIKYSNEFNVVESPTILDYNSGLIKLAPNIDYIIISGEQYYSTVYKDDFHKTKDYYSYTLNIKPGFYTIEAYDNKNNKSRPININIYDSEIKSELASKQNLENTQKQDAIELIAIRNECFEKIIKGDNNYLIYNQLLFNSYKIDNNVSEPIIVTNTSDKLEVKIDYIHKDNYYLCLDEAEDLNLGTLVFRISLNMNIKTYTFLKSKYLLRKNQRYCLWIEDNKGNIISNINSFEFGNSNSDTTKQLNEITVNNMKTYLKEMENRHYLLSYNIDNKELNASELFDEIIINAFNYFYTYAHRKTYIIDAINAKASYYNVTMSNLNNNILITYSNDNKQLSIKPNNYNGFNSIYLSLIQDEKIVHYTLDSNEIIIPLDNIIGISFQFINHSNNNVSKPIIIDVLNKTIIQNAGAKIEVIK